MLFASAFETPSHSMMLPKFTQFGPSLQLEKIQPFLSGSRTMKLNVRELTWSLTQKDDQCE
jgi:hypothetical protein